MPNNPDLTAVMAEILARDDCPIKGWVGIISPPTSPRPETLIKLLKGNPAMVAISDVTTKEELLKGHYFRFDTLLPLGVYNEPDDGRRRELRTAMLMSLAKEGNMYMTVRMSFREAKHRSRFFTDEELMADFKGAFKSVKVITFHNKWTQLVHCTGRIWA